MEVYKFPSLRSLVEESFDVNVDEFESSFEFEQITIEIKSHEFKDKIELSNEGIFFKKDGNLIKGFLYIEKGYNPAFQRATIIPKFHVTECRTINDQKARNNFDGHYVFSNVPVTMKDIDGLEKDLPLCKNCIGKLLEVNPYEAALIGGRVISTAEYNETILKNPAIIGNLRQTTLPRDSFEKVIEWGHCTPELKDIKSYFYEKHFSCEICKIKLDGARGYFLKIHFRDGDENNRLPNNLECLCPECYAQKGNKYDDDKLEIYRELKKLILDKDNKYEKLAGEVQLTVTSETESDSDVLNGLNSIIKVSNHDYQQYHDQAMSFFKEITNDELKSCVIDARIKYLFFKDIGDYPEACRLLIIQLEAFFIFFDNAFIEWVEECRPNLRGKLVNNRISNFYNKYWIAKEYFNYFELDCDMLNRVYWIRNGKSHATIGQEKEKFDLALSELNRSPDLYFSNIERFIAIMADNIDFENF